MIIFPFLTVAPALSGLKRLHICEKLFSVADCLIRVSELEEIISYVGSQCFLKNSQRIKLATDEIPSLNEATIE